MQLVDWFSSATLALVLSRAHQLFRELGQVIGLGTLLLGL